MSRYIDVEWLKQNFNTVFWSQITKTIDSAPSIDIVQCKECKHRPIKEDVNGENYGFNLIEPTKGDERCPCLISDGWYSWMPKDNFYCGFGERKDKCKECRYWSEVHKRCENKIGCQFKPYGEREGE